MAAPKPAPGMACSTRVPRVQNARDYLRAMGETTSWVATEKREPGGSYGFHRWSCGCETPESERGEVRPCERHRRALVAE